MKKPQPVARRNEWDRLLVVDVDKDFDDVPNRQRITGEVLDYLGRDRQDRSCCSS